jgi:hypothetical protein
MSQSLGDLFGNIEAVINDISELEKPLGDGDEKDLSLDTGSKTLSLFDTPVKIDASLDAKAQIFKPNAVPDSPFDGSVLTAPANMQYAALTIDGKISAAADVKATEGVIALSASASASTGFAYSHYRPMLATATRLKAFAELATTTQLPQLLDPSSLTDGETVDFQAMLNVDFALTAKYGATADIKGVIDILEGLGDHSLPLPFTAHIGFTASAAFGFSLYESVRLTSGRAATTNAGWVRVRLDRAHKRRISFGVAVDLTIDYDATAGAQALLDKAFALVPTIPAIETLKKIAALPADFDAFKKAISDEAAVVVGRLVDDLGWKNALAASPAVADLIQTANAIVKAYDGIDDKVKSVLEEVLAKLNAAGLDKVKPVIDKVAAIDPSTFKLTSLLNPVQQDVIHWIEVLSGRDVSDLLVSQDITKSVTTAVAAAKKIQGFLSGAEADVLAKIHAILDKSGATALVAWLKKNATSVADLQAAGDKAVGDFVRRIVGKELDKISAADVQKIQTFAAKLEQILNAPDALKTKLQAGVAKLKGTVGFSFSSEISRVTESSAIIDVEIDPTNVRAVKAAKGLLNGQFEQFLSDLNQIDTKPRPYLIREIVLTSRHVRTIASTTLLSIFRIPLGEQESAIDESTLTVRQDGDDVVRDALYFGGAVSRRTVGTAVSESAAWIRMTATGAGSDITAPYTTVTPAIRLSYTREDTDTDKEARKSLFQLLLELSFNSALAKVSPSIDGQQTRFALELEFGGDSVAALKKDSDETRWKKDVLIAAHRWFSDADRLNPDEEKAGAAMAAVVLNQRFAQVWTDVIGDGVGIGDAFFAADRAGDLGIELLMSNQKKFQIQYASLLTLMTTRSHSFGHFGDFNAANAANVQPKILAKTSQQAADLFRTGQPGWAPPLFNFWFVLTRLLRVDPDVFTKARAVVTIQTRPKSTDDWSAPDIFAMPNGVSSANLRLS